MYLVFKPIKMDRKAIANETIEILRQGFYEYKGKKIEILEEQKKAVKQTKLITPEEGERLIKKIVLEGKETEDIRVENISTVQAILEEKKEAVGVLNFASAKNPGGGFLNGAKAQEESLAASGGLYQTLLTQPRYYEENRAYNSMIYTDFAIYSKNVVFFRDERFQLIEKPVIAEVLTLPAVNMGQVRLKGEDIELAKEKMKNRMRLSLAIFANEGAKNLILGAYGCGVFRNDPKDVARWWKELLLEEGYAKAFESILFAVYTKDRNCIGEFEKNFE